MSPEVLGILAEQISGERRVALVPSDVHRLCKFATIIVERGAGSAAGFADDDYAEAGATEAERLEAVSTAQVLVSVRARSDVATFQAGTMIISLGGCDDRVGAAVTTGGLKHLWLERRRDPGAGHGRALFPGDGRRGDQGRPGEKTVDQINSDAIGFVECDEFR